jgi:uncharacterized membrane protein
MKPISRLVLFLLVVSALFVLSLNIAFAQTTPEAVVRAVLFYSPTCSHCEQVIKNDLPPLKQQYGEKLLIFGIDISLPDGLDKYQKTVTALSIPDNRLGVPTLIIGENVLVGSVEIPEQLPGLVEQYLAQGGVDWPAIPDIKQWYARSDPASLLLQNATQTSTPEAAATELPTQAPTAVPPTPTPTAIPPFLLDYNSNQKMLTSFTNDQPANSLAVIVLAAMVVTVSTVIFAVGRPLVTPLRSALVWLIPLLALVGLGVSAYLSYVELRQVEAVCWPIGQCNLVQQSEYAWVAGVLPVGVLGLVGYGGILLAWLVSRVRLCWLAKLASAGLMGMALFGVLFSIILTFLEPFIIGATCLWCLVSAVLVTILFVLSVPYFWSVRRAQGC